MDGAETMHNLKAKTKPRACRRPKLFQHSVWDVKRVPMCPQVVHHGEHRPKSRRRELGQDCICRARGKKRQAHVSRHSVLKRWKDSGEAAGEGSIPPQPIPGSETRTRNIKKTQTQM